MATKNIEKYETLVNNLSVGIYRNTPGAKGRFLEVNPAMVSIFEADSKEELMKHRVSDLYQNPVKRDLFVKKMMKYGSVKNEELNLVTLKGKKIIASVSAVMKKEKNRAVYFDGIIENITERKKIEKALKDSYAKLEVRVKERTEELNKHVIELEDARKAMINVFEDLNMEKIKAENMANDLSKFKLALDNASDNVIITDINGTVVYSNNAVEKITGYTSAEVLGKKAGVLWKTSMPKEFYQKLWHTIKEQKKVFVGEIKNKRKNGQVYNAMINISPVLNKFGDIIFFVGLERDITKEKEVDKAKTEFVSLASHQLRTPLTAIRWYTEMFLSGDLGKIIPVQKKYLEEIYQDNQRMIELVNMLLDISRIELGTLKIESELTDIIALAHSVVGEQKPNIKNKKITLTENFSKDIVVCQTDPKFLRMVFQNILNNAITYTSPGGKIEFSISLDGNSPLQTSNQQNKKNIFIKISDTGYGIPKDQQDKIFTKLFRADNIREKDTNGTGLGLYLVKSIVESLGGKIWFESPASGRVDGDENPGTTFYVTLPFITKV